VGGSIGFNTGNSDVYGVSSAGLANGWHHIAVEFTNGSVTSNRMYIDGVEQVLTQRQGTPSNSRAFVNSELRIGGWSVNRSYDFRGLIDEVRVYQGSLTTNEVTTIMAERHACYGLTHFEIQHDGIGLTCEAETLTIKACANANCDKLYTQQTSITLTPSGWSGGDTLVFTGALTTSLRITDQSSITFAKTSANPDAGLRCFKGSTETCTMEFVDAGFEFIGATVNDKSLTDQLAETQFSNVQLRSVQNNNGVCQAALTGNQTVTLGYNCDSPDKCLTSLAGIAISNPNGENTGDITLNFSSAGIASLAVLNYADAGRLTLSAQANIDGATLLKGTGLVDVYPASLGLNVTPTSLEYTGVADTSTFTAGEPFEFKIGAFGAAGNLLPNYQPERMQLKVSRTYPVASGTLDGKFRYASAAELGSSAGAISFVDVSSLSFVAGEYSYTGAYYDEVGRIAVDVQDLSYLGNKISSQGELPLGHFVPAYYTVEIESPLPALQNVQADFTYVGQRILFSTFPAMKVTAKNALDNTTNNHDSVDWTFRPTLSDVNNALKLSYLDKSAYPGDATVFKGNAPVISGDTNYDGSVFITVPDSTIVYNKTDVNYTMFGPVNPFSALFDIVFHAAFLTDNNGICFRDNYADTSCNDLTFADVTGADLRFGRFALKSTYGPENEMLRPEFAVEYYKDGQWLVNALDNETTINFSQANNQLLLSKKGAGNDLTGSFDPVTSDGKLLLGLPDDKNDFKFSAPGQPGEVYLRLNPAADPNAWPQYLNYDWNGDGKICNQVGLCVNGNGLDYPQATLSFGLFRGNDRVIQWREVFN
jgi:MSHA biogenesis protein MshQ